MFKINLQNRTGRSLFFLLFFANLLSPLLSQTNKPARPNSHSGGIDSLKHQLSKDSAYIYRIKPVRPIVAIDQRNSFLGKKKIDISGFQLGLTLYEKHTLGLGFYSIQSSKRNMRIIGDKKENLNQNLQLKYLTVFYHYPLIDKKYFDFGLPVEAGLGYFTINVTDSTGASIPGFPRPKAPMLIFGGGISLSVKPIRWAGIHFIAGYRVVKDNNTRLNFNGPFYAFGLQLYLHQIIQDSRYFIKKRNYKREMTELFVP